MNYPAIVLAAFILASLTTVIIWIDRRMSSLKARGMTATPEEIESMSITELRIIRDLLEPDIRDRTEAARANFRLIADTYRHKQADRATGDPLSGEF